LLECTFVQFSGIAPGVSVPTSRTKRNAATLTQYVLVETTK